MKFKPVAIAFILGLAFAATAGLPAAAAQDRPDPLQGDQVVFGGGVTVGRGETQHDAVAFGGNVLVEGTVTNDVVAFGGNVVINGSVGHDVVAFGGNVTLGPQSRVEHNVAVVGGTLSRAEGAFIGGQVVYGSEGVRLSGFPFAVFGPRRAGFPGFRFGGLIFGIISAIGIVLLALVLLLFLPRQLQTTGAVLERRPLETFALGCGGALAGIFLAILFGITIIFSPVSFLIGIALTAGWLFGWAAIFIITGQRLLRSVNRPAELVFALLLGGALWSILANIPILNLVVIAIGGSLALGAALLSRFGTQGPGAPMLGSAQPAAPPPPPVTS